MCARRIHKRLIDLHSPADVVKQITSIKCALQPCLPLKKLEASVHACASYARLAALLFAVSHRNGILTGCACVPLQH
jgi:hypothetical protein